MKSACMAAKTVSHDTGKHRFRAAVNELGDLCALLHSALNILIFLLEKIIRS